MPDQPREPHHPLPSDPRARSDLLPEAIARRDRDDIPSGDADVGRAGGYRDPDDRAYPA